MPCLLLRVSLTRTVSRLGRLLLPPRVFLSACLAVRTDGKKWQISGVADHWKGKLDVRDLGGLLDTPLR